MEKSCFLKTTKLKFALTKISLFLLMIIFFSIFLKPVKAAIFSDGFESGDCRQWDSNISLYNSNLDATSVLSRQGTFSMNVTINTPYGIYTNPATVGGHASCTKQFSNYTDLYTRFYFYLNDTYGLSQWSNVSYPILLATHAFGNGTSNFYANSVFLWKGVDNKTIYIGMRVRRDNKRFTFNFTNTAIDNKTWYCVEFRTRKGSGDGISQLWINGIQVFSWINLDNDDSGDLNKTRIGLDASIGDITSGPWTRTDLRDGTDQQVDTIYVQNAMNSDEDSNPINYKPEADITSSQRWVPDGSVDVRDNQAVTSFFSRPISGFEASSDNIQAFFDSVVIDTNYIGPLGGGPADITPPTYSSNSTNSTFAGTPIKHSLTWIDNLALNNTGGYIFSFDNGTGTFVNDSFIFFGEIPQQSTDWNNGLVALWHINEGSGTSISDSSGYGHTITLKSNPTSYSLPTFVSGKFSNAVNFTNDIANINYGNISYSKNDELDNVTKNNSFTLSAWANSRSSCPSVAGTTECFIISRAGAHLGLNLVSTNRWRFRIVNSTNNATTIDSSVITIGKWYLVTGTYDASTGNMSLYVNGSYQSSKIVTGGIRGYTTWYLGAGTSGGTWNQSFNGTIDEVAVWNRVLSAQEISNLYNLQSGFPTQAWTNVTKVVNSASGKTIRWCVYANDASNNWNDNSCQNPFSYVTTSGDNTPPTYSNSGSSSILVAPGDQVKIFANWNDNGVLDTAWLSTNETGNWINYTGIYGSPKKFSGKPQWSNFTWMNTSFKKGVVAWKIYANDTGGNEAVTSGTFEVIVIYNFEVWAEGSGFFTTGTPQIVNIYVRNTGNVEDSYNISYNKSVTFPPADNLVQINLPSYNINLVKPGRVGNTFATVTLLGPVTSAEIWFNVNSTGNQSSKETKRIPIKSDYPISLPEFQLIGFLLLLIIPALVIFYSSRFRH